MSPLPEAGVYVVAVEVCAELHLRVGALGPMRFVPGTYLYVGSAKRSLPARVQRHRTASKPLRWHIDYLTSAACVTALWAWPLGEVTECGLAELLGRTADVVKGFGASDCACAGHLFRDGTGAAQGALEALLPASVQRFDARQARR